jgi:hypothetical protein
MLDFYIDETINCLCRLDTSKNTFRGSPDARANIPTSGPLTENITSTRHFKSVIDVLRTLHKCRSFENSSATGLVFDSF